MTEKEIMELAEELASKKKAEHEEEQRVIREVREKYKGVKFPNVFTRPTSYMDGDRNIEIDNKIAIIGETTTQVWNKNKKSMEEVHIVPHYAFASNQYKIERHETAIKFMEESLQELSSEFKDEAPVITPSIFEYGARMTVNVTFPGVKYEITGAKWTDKLNPQVELRNSYDTSWEMMFKFKALQEVCKNGMMATKTLQKIGQKHRQNLNTAKLASKITGYMDNFSEQIGMWQSWNEKLLSSEGVENIMESLSFSEKRLEEVKELPLQGRGVNVNQLVKSDDLTFWDLNSALTQFATHEVESDMVRIDLTQRTSNTMDYHFKKAA